MAFELTAGDPLVFFAALAALIFIGFLGNVAFSKLRINDTVLLILLGVLLGPVGGLLTPDDLAGVSAIVGPLALILILFDGGLALKLRDLVHGVAGAVTVAVVGFTLTVALVGAVASVLLDVSWLVGFILGAILGGTSSVIVLPSLQFIPCERRTATLLSLESALTDVFVVVGVFAMVGIAAAGTGPDAQGIASDVGILFGMSILVGGLAALAWMALLPSIRDKAFSYMMTLGAAFALYVAVEWLLADTSAGGGPLAVLAFGIVLGNGDALPSLHKRIGDAFGSGLKRFQGELAFLVRTFFFVYLGILVDPGLLADVVVVSIGILIFVAQVVARGVAIAAASRRLRFGHEEWVQWAMMPRGLACAVMAAVPAEAGIAGSETFVAIAFLTVVLSNLTTTVGGFLLGKPAVPPSAAPTASALDPMGLRAASRSTAKVGKPKRAK